MTTDAQINANRENAQKSTGPVTAEGKAVVSQNALNHGLFAVQDVLTTENQAEFDLLREQMLAQLAPGGAVESMLAHRAISLSWRLRRAETMQAQVTQDMVESHIIHEQVNLGRRTPKEPREVPEYLAIGRVAKRDWGGERLIERLFEYERRIEKSLYKTMAELRAMQLMRQMSAVAETQRPAQPAKETNSEKQSQFQQWPDTYGIDPKELIAFAKKTYGRTHPEMVEALLKRWKTTPAGPKAICGPQTQRNGRKTGAPLSLMKL